MRFYQDLWNHFAHVRKWLKTFQKFMKTIWIFLNKLWTLSNFCPTISFAKHNLFSFEIEQYSVLRRRTVICMHFSIHYWFEYKLQFLIFSWLLTHTHVFSSKVWEFGLLVWVNMRSKFTTHRCETRAQGKRVGRYIIQSYP